MLCDAVCTSAREFLVEEAKPTKLVVQHFNETSVCCFGVFFQKLAEMATSTVYFLLQIFISSLDFAFQNFLF